MKTIEEIWRVGNKSSAFVLVALFSVLCITKSSAQSCTTNGVNSFFTYCETGSSYTLNGNYSITVKNGDTIYINGNVIINGTLTITMNGSAGFVEVMSPYTLKATNITFSGSATGKNLIVDGPSAKIVVPGTLNFGGLNLDIDTNGTAGGSITAGTVTGGSGTTCSSDGSCPIFTATNCTGGGICNGQGLPIHLSRFSANSGQSVISLNWTTESELNFDFFSIEHSSNGNDFVGIGQVSGHGTTNIQQTYAFVDTSPLMGRNYYRLKSIDLDNSFEYSNVIMMDFKAEKYVSIYPNPLTGNSITLSINFERSLNDQIEIFDNLGRVKYQAHLPVDENKIEFASALPSGIYLLKFVSGEYVKVIRLIINEG